MTFSHNFGFEELLRCASNRSPNSPNAASAIARTARCGRSIGTRRAANI